nr:MAG TPA: hypothetical protein [Bacteriophage sp.]
MKSSQWRPAVKRAVVSKWDNYCHRQDCITLVLHHGPEA